MYKMKRLKIHQKCRESYFYILILKIQHVSSISVKLYLFFSLSSNFIFVQLPNTCTSIIAFVFFVSFLSISFMFIFKLSISTSTKIGFRPDCIIGHKEVDQHNAGIRTSSPLLSLFFYKD